MSIFDGINPNEILAEVRKKVDELFADFTAVQVLHNIGNISDARLAELKAAIEAEQARRA